MANYLGLRRHKDVKYQIVIKNEKGVNVVVDEDVRNLIVARERAQTLTDSTGIRHFVNTVNISKSQ
jgi:hypothetical protein